jgi:hypothetical protein
MFLTDMDELEVIISAARGDYEKCFGKQNLAAGVRLRKAMAQLKRKADHIRRRVQESRSAKQTDDNVAEPSGS